MKYCFGRAAEWYTVNRPLLINARLIVYTLICEGFIKLRRVEATDYIEWETSGGGLYQAVWMGNPIIVL